MARPTQTHTYAILEVPQHTFDTVVQRIREETEHEQPGGRVTEMTDDEGNLMMHGLALKAIPEDLSGEHLTPSQMAAAIIEDVEENVGVLTQDVELKSGAIVGQFCELTGKQETLDALNELRAVLDAPIPMLLWCPECGRRHVDGEVMEKRPHHTHACQFCGHVWRPTLQNTTGVQFLPGYKDAETLPPTLVLQRFFESYGYRISPLGATMGKSNSFIVRAVEAVDAAPPPLPKLSRHEDNDE